jgi:hypothetical protein
VGFSNLLMFKLCTTVSKLTIANDYEMTMVSSMEVILCSDETLANYCLVIDHFGKCLT